MRHHEQEESVLRVRFPESALIYLRHWSTTSDFMTIIVETPGGSVSYETPILKVQKYTIDEIFDKKLLFLLPFHIFVYEKQFKRINEDEEKLLELEEHFADIINRLDIFCKEQQISEYIKWILLRMCNIVLEKLVASYENVKEGVGAVMGVEPFDFPEIRSYHAGLEEGMELGLEEGKAEGKVEGKAEGIGHLVECLRELQQTNEFIIQKIIEKFQVTEEEAKRFL